MTNPESIEPTGGSEDKGAKVGLVAVLPLVIVTTLVILVVVWLVAR